MNEIGIDIEKARIQYIKQLTYAQMNEERHKAQRQKIDNALVELSNKVALRISDYINGEPYNSYYELEDAVFHIDAIQNYLNSVFNLKFVVKAGSYSYKICIDPTYDDTYDDNYVKEQAKKWQNVYEDTKTFL